MKIAWFTPFSKESAIARFSSAVVRELNRLAEVHVWHPPAADPLATGVRRVSFRRASEIQPENAAAYDLLVYNLGNHLPFHREIFEISRRLPGICVMHDFVMHHFFAAYYLEYLRDHRGYAQALGRLYGTRGRKAADETLAGTRTRIWETDEVVEFPFFEEAVRGSYGVFTHSEFLRRKIAEAYPGPVAHSFLPYEVRADKEAALDPRLVIPESKILILTVGHVNPNKRVHSVLEALAANRDLLDRVTYCVLGPCETHYASRLHEYVAREGLGEAVQFLGYVDDRLLHAHLGRADLCVNLRFPAFEGASASLIEQMLHGKAVIVTDTGFYSELPDDCVVKILPGRENQDLPGVLRRLVLDPSPRRIVGERARSFADTRARADVYARRFLEFALEVTSARPLLQLSDRLTLLLREMQVSPHMQIVDTLARDCEQLFSRPDGPAGRVSLKSPE